MADFPHLFGQYYVKPTATACVRAWSLCQGHARDYQAIRRHALKLAFWPGDADIDWDWIISLKQKRVGELRIDEVIAGCNNLRVIFFKANKVLPGEPMARIWTLTVVQKKRQEWTGPEIAAFRTMRDIVFARNYGNIPGA